MPLSTWRKSSYSESSESSCVEVAVAPTAVAVRDSKDTTGPTLTFDPEAWRTLTSTVGQ